MADDSQEKLRLPLVRRVFRQDARYICGLCKSDYKNYGAANSCMNQCWFDVHNFYPVVKRKRGPSTWTYRCLFCCRDFNNEINAYSCARRCVGIRNKAQVREQLLNGQPLPPPSHPVSHLIQMTRGLHQTEARKKALWTPTIHRTLPLAARDTFNRPSGDGVLVERDPSKGLHKRSFATVVSFHRSRYQCNYCKTSYTSQSDGQKCFAGHFNEEGFEKIVSIDSAA